MQVQKEAKSLTSTFFSVIRQKVKLLIFYITFQHSFIDDAKICKISNSTFLYLGFESLIPFVVQLYDRTRARKVEVFGLRSCKGENHPSILICGNEFSPPHFSSSWVVLFLGPNWWWSCNIRLLLTYSTKEMSCRQPNQKTAISEKQQNIKRFFSFVLSYLQKIVDTESRVLHDLFYLAF